MEGEGVGGWMVGTKRNEEKIGEMGERDQSWCGKKGVGEEGSDMWEEAHGGEGG